MPAPKTPNTAAATAVTVRRGDETAAARLRSHGWLVVEPEVLDNLTPELVQLLRRIAAPGGAGR